eukprot:TRINITY_DN31968_c0_g1_i2.p1 TRINITY_DN31968_c0_g1~~TRINITY_DN31968_c0_g1_i2.p1  ORF type:complete len:240 (-),score=11.70 TRINITY_DN31968_c0_g1_i2:462-1181(-)
MTTKTISSNSLIPKLATLFSAYKQLFQSQQLSGYALKEQLSLLYLQATQLNAAGKVVVDALLDQKLSTVLWPDSLLQSLPVQEFTLLYQFTFFICREAQFRTHLQVDDAIRLWQWVLEGRFRLINCWCQFTKFSGKTYISEDTWKQVYNFAQNINEDLSNYNSLEAWPVMMDEFVEYMTKTAKSNLVGGKRKEQCTNAQMEQTQSPLENQQIFRKRRRLLRDFESISISCVGQQVNSVS